MPATTVVNLRTSAYDVYIGRPRQGEDQQHHWGNPFTHLPESRASIVLATRAQAIEAFRAWLEGTDYQDVEPARRQWILEHLEELRGKRLGCFCLPQACHGDVYATLLNEGTPTVPAFRGPLAFCSNFFVSPIVLKLRDGMEITAPTVEHAYQAMKTTDRASFRWVIVAPTPAIAKQRGRRVPMRPDFPAKKLDVMRYLLAKKFAPGSALAAQLKATGDTPLVEENTWGDTYWGVCRGVGENHLGTLLMELRATL